MGHSRERGPRRRSDEPPSDANTSRSRRGEPLTNSLRAQMESSFGHNFGDVRIHDDGASHDAARAFDAAAFTVGSDIFLAEGQRSADETAGQHLLAHELAHVVQNDRAGASLESSRRSISAPGDAFETEASRAALTALAGGTPTVAAAPGAVVARAIETPQIPAWLETIRRNAIGDVGTPPPVSYSGPHNNISVNKAGGLTFDQSEGYGVKSDAGSIDTYSFQGHGGAWQEGDSTRHGFRAGANTAKAALNENYVGEVVGDPTLVVGADVGVGTANAEANIGSDGFAIGAQANIAEGSISGGNKNPESDTDEWARFGLSLGGGLALRGHGGDEDKDGTRSYGFGADIGPFSFDIKSEDPVRTGMRLGGTSILPEENLTKALGSGVSDYVDTVGSVMQQVPSLPTGVIPGLDAVQSLGISLPSYDDILSLW
jgi:hypothetical protein